jgi:hypothetical protein
MFFPHDTGALTMEFGSLRLGQIGIHLSAVLFPSTFSVLWPLETESNGWEKGHGGSVDLRIRQHILTLRNVQSAAALDQVDVLFQSIKGYKYK